MPLKIVQVSDKKHRKRIANSTIVIQTTVMLKKQKAGNTGSILYGTVVYTFTRVTVPLAVLYANACPINAII